MTARDPREGQRGPSGSASAGAGEQTAQARPSSSTSAGADASAARGSGGGAGPAPAGSASSLLPALSVPKGGGAVRGIGEKFAVNAATGTTSLSVPLPISPARSGFGPALDLSYASGGGNGPFGIGFHLSVPSITRKTDKGLPRYLDNAESDEFMLSGAEDLVPLRNAAGAISEEPRTLDGVTYQVRRYRPRVEGLFAKIERWIPVVTGQPSHADAHFRVTTKDNVTHIYGTGAASRITDPSTLLPPRRPHVFSWLLEESRDDKGNIVRYEYKGEDGVNVPRSLSEKTRFESQAGTPVFIATAERYLKRVLYGNKAPFTGGAPNDFLFELVFDYGDHGANPTTPASVPTPVPTETWPVRPDPVSSYRSGFEIRSYRLCRRVLRFHRFTAVPLLVKSTDFTYEESAVVTYLTGITQAGYLNDASTGNEWRRDVLPALRLDYTRATIHDELRKLPEESLAGLTGGIDGARVQWVDLDGEGIPGVLIDADSAWYYKSNRGEGRLTAPKALKALPSPHALGIQQLEDLGGDGDLDLVSYQNPLAGYFTRTRDGGFEPLRHFHALPNIDFANPNLRFLDIDGDGLSDILITEGNALVYYRSRGKEGFDPPRRIAIPSDEERGPHVLFADHYQTVQLADMGGDGLMDIVRIQNGSVCYWPNLGYGKFGPKISLENSPTFDTPEQFDARRLRFGDVDGSGTSDIFYLHRSGARLYLNQSGNRLSAAIPILSLPPVDNQAHVTITDLLGQGTATIVWSSPLPGARQVFYVDLMGGTKPHLLSTVTNNLGAETRISYAPSTKYYLEDRANPKTTWLTRLAFPVQVVAKLERIDAISKSRLVSTYRYRHGYFDGAEREFRGFARVEQLDAEEFTVGADTQLFQAPVKTVSWFHTGAWLEKERLETALAKEYFQEGPSALLVPDTIYDSDELGVPFTIQDKREGARALRGSMLRQEVYADDGTQKAKNPYVVTEQNFAVRRLQPSAPGKHGVFFTHPREAVSLHTERNPADPRVTHELVLDVDAFGNLKRKASIAYGRSPANAEQPEQQESWATLVESDFINEPSRADFYRLGIEYESRSFELTGLALPAGGQGLIGFDALQTALQGATDIDFEATPTAGVQRRLIDRKQQLFYENDLSGPLALGVIESLALPYETYQLALTTGIVSQLATDSLALSGTAFDATLLVSEGKYVQRDQHYWAPSGRVIFDAARFHLPIEAVDPFGAHSFVTYDTFSLLVTTTRDPLGNTTSAEPDYRVLAPSLVTDANLNRTAVAFDALGMVVKTAVMGKEGANEGDTLEHPTTELQYDLLRWQREQKPAVVHTIAREEHFSDNASSRLQHAFAYSDGFGRIVQQKVQAEPETGTSTPRWVGTGRTVFNNKGNPVKQYEPFFSATSDFEDEDAIVQTGVTPIIHYDPLDRVIRTDFPDGTFSKVEFDAWTQTTFDQNDTVLESQWYIDRGSPSPSGAEPSAPDARAAWLAAQHANTPTIAHLDTLGRPFLSDAHNRTGGVDDHYFTKTKLDIEGNTLAIFDARQIKLHEQNPANALRSTIDQTFDVLQRRLKVVSADADTRLAVADVAGKPLRGWDSRGQTQRQRFDALQRPTHAYVRKGSTERLLLRTVYGEALDPPDPPPTDPNLASPAQQANLRGRAHHVYDCAGLVTSIEHDFKGNLLSASRRLAVAYQTEPEWSAGEDLSEPAAILAAVASLLQTETFTTSSTFDALNRVTRASAPDASATNSASVTHPVYNEANLLEAVHVSVRGATETAVITDLDYNARGQRVLCESANGTVITYQYDPKTFRLTELLTLRGGTKLQHLLYSYDPVGNITDIQDLSNWDSVLSALTAAGVTGSGKYQYDAAYRLVSATGREHPGPQPNGRTETEPPRWGIPHTNDLQALQSYREEVAYDAVGNIVEMRHLRGSSNNASWSRRYDYFPENNRLRATSAPGDAIGSYSDPYGYQTDALNDAGRHGSMTSMPHLASMEWDYADRLKHTVKSNGSAQDTYFTYDAAGQRVRKVYAHNGLMEERIYFGGYEVYRRHTSGSITATPDEERQTLHVMDDQRRIAMVETKTRETGATLPTPDSRWRFQLDNHLGSATLELDMTGGVISYEEYHPYGSTALHTANVNAGVSAKRYRYTGKEKDDETGLYYHGARYYAPWLGRWMAADPAGMIDGLNLYRYARNNPMKLLDPNGMQSQAQTFEDRSIQLEVKHAGSADSLQYSLSVDLQKRGTGDRFGYTSSGGAAGLRAVHQQLMRSEGFAEALTPAEREHLFATIEDFARDVPSDGTLYGAPSSEGGPTLPNTSDTDGGSNFTGRAGVTTYESNVRKGYESRIKRKSAQAVEAIDDAAREGHVAKAEGAAREASSLRNQERAAAQRRLLPGGRALSSALEKERTYEQLAKKYAVPGKPIDTAREVAKAAGRSNRVVSGLSRAGRVLGPIGLGIGVGLGVREYVNAPPERKAAVAAGETGALIGGAIGFSLGTGAATLALGTALAVSGPVGWAALGAVLLTGAVAGYFGAEWGRSLTSGFFE